MAVQPVPQQPFHGRRREKQSWIAIPAGLFPKHSAARCAAGTTGQGTVPSNCVNKRVRGGKAAERTETHNRFKTYKYPIYRHCAKIPGD